MVMSQAAGLATGRQVRNDSTGLAAPHSPREKWQETGEGQRHLSDDIPGPLRLLGLLVLSSVKPGFHPAPFVWFGNEEFKGHP